MVSVKSSNVSQRFDPKKALVSQFGDNLEAIFVEQDEREAKDNDSDFSAGSF